MKILKILILLGLVFSAGVIAGVAGTRFAVKKVVEQATRKPEVVRAKLEVELARQLKLTPEQRPMVHEIVGRGFEEIQQLRRDFQPKFGAILKRSEREIREVLDERQKVKLDLMLKKRPPQAPALARPDL
jgi:hypothetical protein